MRVGALVLVLLAAAATAAAAAEWAVPKGLVGLLTPEPEPDGITACAPAGAGLALVLRAAPDRESASIGRVAFTAGGHQPQECGLAMPVFTPEADKVGRELPSLESSYEEPALLVLEQRGDWLRIDIGDGSGWLQRPPTLRFDAYPKLLAERLAYATPAWSGEICPAPGRECRKIEPAQEQSLRVLGVKKLDGQDWIEVELTSDPCRDVEERVLARGWIRAHAADGRPAAWFHSRGC